MKEYRLIVSDEGQVVIIGANGEPVHDSVGYKLSIKLIEEYEYKTAWVYFAQSLDNSNLYKIGITKNLSRREHEIKARILHKIPCSRPRIRLLEKKLHEAFEQWSIGNEWFNFGEGDGSAVINKFREHVTTQRELICALVKLCQRHPWEWNDICSNDVERWKNWSHRARRTMPEWLMESAE